MPRPGSKPISLTLPVSITQVMSSMVREVSATLVETTTLTVPTGSATAERQQGASMPGQGRAAWLSKQSAAQWRWRPAQLEALWPGHADAGTLTLGRPLEHARLLRGRQPSVQRQHQRAGAEAGRALQLPADPPNLLHAGGED